MTDANLFKNSWIWICKHSCTTVKENKPIDDNFSALFVVVCLLVTWVVLFNYFQFLTHYA